MKSPSALSLLALLPLVLTPALGAPAPAPEAQAAEAQDPPTVKRKRVVKDSARRRAVKERGGSGLLDVLDASVQWLVDHQGADGSWHPVDFVERCGVSKEKDRCHGTGAEQAEVGLTALATLVLLEDGSSTSTGPHAEAVWRAVRFLVEGQQKSGALAQRRGPDFLYQHAIATQVLARAVLSGDESLREPLASAVEYILKARNPYGAWRYDMPPTGDNDTSVTGWMVLALDLAARSGVDVEDAAFEGALAWVHEVTDKVTGRIGYSSRGSRSARIPKINDDFPVDRTEVSTAIGLLLQSRLQSFSPERTSSQLSAELLMEALPDREVFDAYYWYYGTHAALTLPSEQSKTWVEALEAELEDLQKGRKHGHREGSFDPAGPWGSMSGRIGTTALVALSITALFGDELPR